MEYPLGSDGLIAPARSRLLGWLLVPIMLAGLTLLSAGEPAEDEGDEETPVPDVEAEFPDDLSEDIDDANEAVYFESDGTAAASLEEADTLVQSEQWRKAIAAYQRVIESRTRHVHAGEGSDLVISAQEYARRQIAGFPPEALKVYRAIYDAEAKTRLDKADAALDVPSLQAIVAQLFCCSHADEALNILGNYRFERGQWLDALSAWSRLVQHYPDTDCSLPLVMAKMAVCWQKLGRREEASALVESMRQRWPDEQITLAGTTLDIEQVAEKLVAAAEPEPLPLTLSNWPVPGGDASRACLGYAEVEKGQLRWRFTLPRPEITSAVRRDFHQRSLPVPLLYHPAVADGRVFIQTASTVYALEVASGERLWQYPDEPRPPSSELTQDASYAPVVAGGTLFTLLEGNLYAFEARTGKLVWQGTDQDEDDGQPLFADSAPASPVYQAGRVFVSSVQMGGEAESYLAAFDAGTGKQLWRTLACARSALDVLGVGSHASAPTVSESTAYCCTNIGALVALDVASGEVRWALRYESYSPTLKQRLVERGQRWANGPPLVAGGVVYAAPQDSAYLYAVDAPSGRVLWRSPRRGAWYLLGLNARDLFLLGPRLLAVDRQSGRLRWMSDVIQTEAAGHGVVGADAVLVPTSGGLYHFSVQDGRTLGCTRSDEPSNLVATRHGLLCAQASSLSVFRDWRATLERLRAQMTREPSEPQPHLELGRLRRERNELARAADSFREALKLAQAAQQPRSITACRKELVLTYRLRARAPEAQPRPEQALAAYEEALDFADTDTERIGLLLEMAKTGLAAERWGEAVGRYQRILERYANEEVETDDGLTTRAGWIAQLEIDKILAQRGQTPYEDFEKQARALLAEARQTPPDRDKLQRLFDTYPNSQAAWEALLLSCRFYEEKKLEALLPQFLDDHLSQYCSAVRLPPALAALVEHFEGRKQFAVAGALLQWLRRDYSGTGVEIGGKSLEEKLSEPAYQATTGIEARREVAPPVALRWRTGTLLSHTRPRAFTPDGTPPAAAAGLVFLLTKRSRNWHTASYDGLECRNATDGTRRWRRVLGRWGGRGCFVGSQLLIQGRSQILSLDPRTGTVSWRFLLAPDAAEEATTPLPPDLFTGEGPSQVWRRISGMVTHGSRAYVTTFGQKVIALDVATGRKLWENAVKEAICSPSRGQAVVTDGSRVTVCTEIPAKLYSFDASKGALVYSKEIQGEYTRVTDGPVALAAGRRAGLVTSDHRLHVFDLANGKELWQKRLPFSVDRLLVSADQRCVLVQPNVAVNAKLVCLEADTGTEAWPALEVEVDSLKEVLVGGEQAYAVRRSQGETTFSAIGLRDGALLWRTVPFSIFDLSSPVLTDRFLVACGEMADHLVVLFIDRANGKVAADVQLENLGFGSLAVTGDLLCLATRRGLYGYGRIHPQQVSRRSFELATHPAASPAEVSRLASLYFQQGRYQPAVEALVKTLTDRSVSDGDYFQLWGQLAGVAETLHTQKVPVLEAPRFRKPPNIDGDLSDPQWQAHKCIVMESPRFIRDIQSDEDDGKRWGGPNDLSGRLYVGWDDKAVYVAVAVKDNVHRNFVSDTTRWQGDGLIIGVDCENDGGYGYRFASRDYILTLALMDKREQEEDEDEEPEGSYSVKRKEDGSGTVYETAIPWTYLRMPTGRRGTRFGFSIYVVDDDANGSKKGLSWTSGQILHQDKSLLGIGFCPELFGDILLQE